MDHNATCDLAPKEEDIRAIAELPPKRGLLWKSVSKSDDVNGRGCLGDKKAAFDSTTSSRALAAASRAPALRNAMKPCGSQLFTWTPDFLDISRRSNIRVQ